MVAASPQGRTPDLVLAGVAGRLSEGRWLIAAVAVLLLVLVLADIVAPVPAGGDLCGAASVLVGRAAARPRRAAPARGDAIQPPPIASEAGVQAFANALPDPCFILDRRGIVRYANAARRRRLPIRAGESLTFRLRNPGSGRRLRPGRRAAAPPERVEFAERVPTERWFAAWFADSTAPRRPGGEFVVLILDDLSERRRSRPHPRRFRRQCQPRAAHAAGLARRLHRDPAGPGPRRRRRRATASSTIMHEQATRMSRLVDDLLSLSAASR